MQAMRVYALRCVSTIASMLSLSICEISACTKEELEAGGSAPSNTESWEGPLAGKPQSTRDDPAIGGKDEAGAREMGRT